MTKQMYEAVKKNPQTTKKQKITGDTKRKKKYKQKTTMSDGEEKKSQDDIRKMAKEVLGWNSDEIVRSRDVDITRALKKVAAAASIKKKQNESKVIMNSNGVTTTTEVANNSEPAFGPVRKRSSHKSRQRAMAHEPVTRLFSSKLQQQPLITPLPSLPFTQAPPPPSSSSSCFAAADGLQPLPASTTSACHQASPKTKVHAPKVSTHDMVSRSTPEQVHAYCDRLVRKAQRLTSRKRRKSQMLEQQGLHLDLADKLALDASVIRDENHISQLLNIVTEILQLLQESVNRKQQVLSLLRHNVNEDGGGGGGGGGDDDEALADDEGDARDANRIEHQVTQLTHLMASLKAFIV
jgi:hypothetical protein